MNKSNKVHRNGYFMLFYLELFVSSFNDKSRLEEIKFHVKKKVILECFFLKS